MLLVVLCIARKDDCYTLTALRRLARLVNAVSVPHMARHCMHVNNVVELECHALQWIAFDDSWKDTLKMHNQ
jgi:hypothetical protein